MKAFLLLVALSALKAEPVEFTPSQRKAVETEARLAREAFDSALLDYPSARFRDVVALQTADAPQIKPRLCGFINSKNQMGAYTGWKRFLALGEKLYVEGDPYAESSIAVLCDGRDLVSDTLDYSATLKYRGN